MAKQAGGQWGVDGALPNGFTRRQIAAVITPRIQELIILPTEKCNLRCTYCYEDFSIGKMSNTIQLSIEKLLERRVPTLEALTLSWFGGEPLVAKDVVLRLSQFANQLCLQHRVTFSGGLTTNAFLLDKSLFGSLLDCQQNFFQITLDGWGEAHDQVRKFANGRGSFDTIWRNLLELRAVDRPYEILLRIHVRRDNISELPRLMEELAAAFEDDKRFRLDFEHVRNLGGPGGPRVERPVQLRELVAIEAELRKVHRRAVAARKGEALTEISEESDILAINLIATKLSAESAGGRRAADIALGENYICYASKPNSLLIRADGRIGKCTVALADQRNDIGHILADGTISIDRSRFGPWVRGLESLDAATLACPLHALPAIVPRALA